MKKVLSILMTFMLIFMTIGPLPSVFAASFSGTITGSTASEGPNGVGSITVTGATSGAKLVLTPKAGGTSANMTSAGGNDTFNNIEPGIYTVTEEIGGIISASSNEARILPRAVKVAAPDQFGQVMVSDAKPIAKLTMRHDRVGFFSPPTNAKQDGTGVFNVGYAEERVPPGKNYRVVQEINGVTSAESNSIDIEPEPVKLNVTIEGAGIGNNGGAIQVNATRKGNTLYLHKVASGTEPIIRKVEDADSFTFTGLSAGQYYVIQEENGAVSPKSNDVFIVDEMAPTIELKGPATDKVSMPKNYATWEYPVNISDVTVKDNISKPIITFTVSPDRKINTPGIYKITYTATDVAGNSSSITKTVTITPPTLDIDENKIIHTFISGETKPGRKVGDIFVNNVMAEATIKVYQDPGGKPIKTVTRANDATFGEFKVTEIPVGKTYYITQTVNGIESETSIRVDIKDTTKPTIELTGGANGKDTVKFVRGESYVEYGATATDNLDFGLSASIKIDRSAVKMDVPGIYVVKYNVSDGAGNAATEVQRIVVVSPHPVLAIGSNADLGEVGVKNAFPGTKLKLYSVTNSNTPVAVSPTLAVDATTYVFKHPTDLNGVIPNLEIKIQPGSYYVIQEFTIPSQTAPLESARSNIVDVVDINRPYITITGSENISYVWDIDGNGYTYDKDNNIGAFTDPGATAEDYLDKKEELTKKIKRKIMFGNEVICDENILVNPKCDKPLEIEVPGIYTITYSVTTERGAKANDKQRIVTVAPPIVGPLNATTGKSTIVVTETFFHIKTKTVVNLYNTHGQLLESISPAVDATATFKDIPVGLGYYVTQTVNGIESAPSDPINISLFEDANEAAMITAFEFTSVRAYGTIDHKAGTIHVVVPKSTTSMKFKPKFEAIGTVEVNNIEQINGHSEQDFTNSTEVPKKYTVTSKDKKVTKDYEVTVTKATFDTNTWTTTVTKSVVFSPSGGSTALSLDESTLAVKQGVSFIGKDRAIHVPAANVGETTAPVLTIKTLTSVSGPAAQQATEIGWGNSTKPFVQPIEIEMTNVVGKKFARFVHNNNQTFAIIQPSDEQVSVGIPKNSTIIGLVAQPGTYALVNDLAEPKIETGTANTYQIKAVPGAQIYYTTNSSHIAYDRSARKETLASYTLESLDLSNWTRYTQGQQISTPSGELYAFAMKDGIISPLAHDVTIAPTAWKKTVNRPAAKPLSITFNAKVDRKALYTGLISVTDDSTNKKVTIKLSLSPDGKTIMVSPETAFKRGNQYTLHIDRKFKGNTKNNEFLKQPLTQTFIAE